MEMTKFGIFSLMLISSVLAQRSPYAGRRPIGYPSIDTTTTTTDSSDLGNRYGDGENATSVKLPVEAMGDLGLIERIKKLPVDHQPFWYLNWKALEEQRNNPRTYSHGKNHFIDNLSLNPANGQSNSGNNLGNQNSLLNNQQQNFDDNGQQQNTFSNNRQTNFDNNQQIQNSFPNNQQSNSIPNFNSPGQNNGNPDNRFTTTNTSPNDRSNLMSNNPYPSNPFLNHQIRLDSFPNNQFPNSQFQSNSFPNNRFQSTSFPGDRLQNNNRFPGNRFFK